MNIYCFKKIVTLGVSIAAAILILSLPVAAVYRMISYSVPEGDTSFKTYMGYTAITDTSSAQYKLQEQATTDENGLRKIDDYYLVALGSYYSTTIGEKFIIEFDTGVRIKVIIGDIKADTHTDEKNQYYTVYNSNGDFISKNVVEFIVDTSSLDKIAKNWGDISAIEKFKGSVSAIYKLEEITYEKE